MYEPPLHGSNDAVSLSLRLRYYQSEFFSYLSHILYMSATSDFFLSGQYYCVSKTMD